MDDKLFCKGPDQISSVQLLSHVQLLAKPCTAAHQASLSITNSRSSRRLTSIELNKYLSVQFSCLVMSDSLQPHGLKHAPLPCPSLQLPELTQAHVHQVSDVIQPSHPLSSSSLPAFNLSQDQGLFQ